MNANKRDVVTLVFLSIISMLILLLSYSLSEGSIMVLNSAANVHDAEPVVLTLIVLGLALALLAVYLDVYVLIFLSLAAIRNLTFLKSETRDNILKAYGHVLRKSWIFRTLGGMLE